jgi:hypothetical protein
MLTDKPLCWSHSGAQLDGTTIEKCPGAASTARGVARKGVLSMQDESSRALAEEDKRVQAGILRLLLTPGAERRWSVAEIEQEIGERMRRLTGSRVCTPRA